MNTFKIVRVASEICGMNKEEVKLLSELLVDNKNAEELQFYLQVSFQEKLLNKQEELV